MPLSVTKRGRAFDVELIEPAASSLFGVGDKRITRKLHFDDKGGAGIAGVWLAPDNKEYPISRFTQSNSTEGLGTLRPVGAFSAGSEDCQWAKKFSWSSGSSTGRPGGHLVEGRRAE